jgi:hypothetical protein
MKPMNEDEQLAAAWSQLNLVLSFFSRVDTKTTLILGVDLGMLALVFARTPAVHDITMVQVVFALPFIAAIGISLWWLHSGHRPKLDGGTTSLVYFRTIAKMTESHFLDQCQRRSKDQFVGDVLEQTWRNSKILTEKFASLQRAQDATLAASIPWVALLVLTAKPPI